MARGKPFAFTTGCGRAGLQEAFLDRPIIENSPSTSKKSSKLCKMHYLFSKRSALKLSVSRHI